MVWKFFLTWLEWQWLPIGWQLCCQSISSQVGKSCQLIWDSKIKIFFSNKDSFSNPRSWSLTCKMCVNLQVNILFIWIYTKMMLQQQSNKTYNFAIIVKPGTYVNKFVQCFNCTKFEGSNFKNGIRNDQYVKISNWVSMHIFNELQGSLPASWIGHTRWIISVKLKLIRLVVTPVQSHILTDRRMDGRPYGRTDRQTTCVIP